MMAFCYQGDGKDGGDEGGGERSGWGASQVKILLTLLTFTVFLSLLPLLEIQSQLQ